MYKKLTKHIQNLSIFIFVTFLRAGQIFEGGVQTHLAPPPGYGPVSDHYIFYSLEGRQKLTYF